MRSEGTARAAEKVIARCREISTFTETPGQTYRPFLCASARKVQQLVSGWMQTAGLTTWLDNAGNLRGFYSGLNEASPRLFLGSHLDTVPNAGAFDGILGVVLAIGIIEELRGQRLPYSIEVVAFSEEEGIRFGRPFLGSMALTGRLGPEELALTDRDGITMEAALRDFGLDPARLDIAVADKEAIGFLEVHIEQGPVLESEDLSLGLVQTIVGQTRLLLTFTGQSNHAGTTPMTRRHDAVVSAAEWICAVEARALATDGLVATVGRLDARPGVPNVIADEVVASLDVRHAADTTRREAVQALIALARKSAHRRGVSLRVATTMDQAAVPLSPAMLDLLDQAATRTGIGAMRMTSGAGHDAMVLAEHMPGAMLFVRSPGAVSHHPDECVFEEDVIAAIDTVTEFLMLLRNECGTV